MAKGIFYAHSAPSKVEARNFFNQIILEHYKSKEVKTMFTLPAYCHYENAAKNIFPNVQFVCCEKNVDVYNAVVKDWNDKGILVNSNPYSTSFIKYFLNDAFIFLRRYVNPFDAIWLDFCGPYTTNMEKQFQLFFDNRLLFHKHRKTVIGLTLQAAREAKNVSSFIDESNIDLKYFRSKGLFELLQEVAKKNNIKLADYKFHRYINTNSEGIKGVPMILYTFTAHHH